MTHSPQTVHQLQAHLIQRIHAAITTLGTVDAETLARLELAPPPNPDMGDLGFPCFFLGKALRKAPHAIAQELQKYLVPDGVIRAVSTEKAYVNISLHVDALCRATFAHVLHARDRFGAHPNPPTAHWMVEYSSPNTNKPLHLGHVRNNLLGFSIASILAHYGYRVTKVNLINDRGIHICKSMLAYAKWGNRDTPKQSQQKGDHFVGNYYVLFDKKFEEEYRAWQTGAEADAIFQTWKQAQKEATVDDDMARRRCFSEFRDDYFNRISGLGSEAREMLRRWEEGDTTVIELWRTMNGWVYDGFALSYRRMGVSFDLMQYESETYKLGKTLVEDGLKQGILRRRTDGAIVFDLATVGLDGEKVLLREDGTSVYMTQDLGTAFERLERHRVERLVYVVADEQNYHFQVLFKILNALYPGALERCYHLSYGMIRLPEGKMKSREGNVVDADDLMDEMVELAKAETQAKANEGKAHTEGISAETLALRAERIGLAALKYYLLKFSPKTSFEYDPKASIDFLGQTGPYCLFNYARTRSLITKARQQNEASWFDDVWLHFDDECLSRLTTEHEIALTWQLYRFPQIVERAAQTLDPSRIAEYLFELAKGFAFMFTDRTHHPILTCDDPTQRRARLILTSAVGITLKVGLGLLGIEVLEEM